MKTRTKAKPKLKMFNAMWEADASTIVTPCVSEEIAWKTCALEAISRAEIDCNRGGSIDPTDLRILWDKGNYEGVCETVAEELQEGVLFVVEEAVLQNHAGEPDWSFIGGR